MGKTETVTTARSMRQAAGELLGALEGEGREKLMRPFSDEAERRTWYYWPSARKGLPLGEMGARQQTAAFRLLASGLSLTAYAKATAIVALERVLDELEGRRLDGVRDPALYHVTVFGDPAGDAWGWRLDGHHVCLHYTVVGDEVACAPLFLGANPAEVRREGRVVSRPLGEEEDAARALLKGLEGDRRRRAVVDSSAPDDILTRNRPELGELPPAGLPAAEMGAAERRLVEELVAVYVERMPPATAGRELDRVAAAGWERVVFAWAGSAEPGGRHYYRLLGPTFLIEYDNTQNDANHIHAVWRDRERDYGADLLRAHLRQHHPSPPGEASG